MFTHHWEVLPFGNVITSEGSLSYIIGGGSHFMDYDAFGTEALCSYDPNDKLVWPTGKRLSHFTLRDTGAGLHHSLPEYRQRHRFFHSGH